ncbi:MAG TPA: hypothetical protein VJB11_01070 [archaeon]|nr:hypothetical protein [archaeon]
MGKVIGTDKDITVLNTLSDSAYDKFCNVLGLPEEERDLYFVEKAYKDIHEELLRIVFPSANSYRCLNKGGKRTGRIEKFILETVLVYDPRATMHTDRYVLEINEDPDDCMGGLKVYIDMEDPKKVGEGAEKGEIFRRLQHRATELRDMGKFDIIFKSMSYVREKYKAYI